jgi:aminocarboxymuconate-semialdehyde decarboxylase
MVALIAMVERYEPESMDEAGVDLALISLSSPNVYLAERASSIKSAQVTNDEFAAAAAKHPARIKWMASLPWNFPQDALAELRRARQAGAIAVCMLTNIAGTPLLTDERYRPIWSEIEATGLPVFVHPTLPKTDYGLLVGGGAARVDKLSPQLRDAVRGGNALKLFGLTVAE